MQKIHQNIQQAILQVLEKVILHGEPADMIIANMLKSNKKWGSRDRKTIASFSYDMIRNYTLLDYLTPEYESIIDTFINNIYEKTNYLQFIKEQNKDIEESVLYSLPIDFNNLLKEQDYVSAMQSVKAMHEKAPIYLRMNNSLISKRKFIENLQKESTEFELIENLTNKAAHFESLACVLLKLNSTKQSKFLTENPQFYEIQDLGSQLITLFSKVEEGQKVLETCAGNGGKTAHLVDLIPSIDITAFDVHENKLNNLSMRMARLGKRSIRTLVNIPENQEKVKQKMDVILMDMPCSGSGTIKRQPDLKYKINQKNIEEKVAIQRAIFNDFAPMLKDNGRIIYSTCSILEAENERQIEWIEKKGYTCTRQFKLDPASYAGDGFFMAEIIKKG